MGGRRPGIRLLGGEKLWFFLVLVERLGDVGSLEVRFAGDLKLF